MRLLTLTYLTCKLVMNTRAPLGKLCRVPIDCGWNIDYISNYKRLRNWLRVGGCLTLCVLLQVPLPWKLCLLEKYLREHINHVNVCSSESLIINF